jgi:hypothetical protein
MFQNKMVFKILIATLFLMSCLSITGCITLAVDSHIHHPRFSMVDNYFSPTDKQFRDATYLGIETIKGQRYARIEVQSIPEGCIEGHSTIELLLPMEKNSDAKATVRRTTPADKQLLVKDQFTGQPVKLIFYLPSKDKEITINDDMSLMLESYKWRGYPSVVVIFFKLPPRYNHHYISSLAYRISPEKDNFNVCQFNSAGYSAEYWTCTKKENRIAGIILKPFAVLLDIITSPIQFLGMLIILIVGRGGP